MSLNEQGFSLLELVVAIAVAGVIAMIAVPIFSGLVLDANDKATEVESALSSQSSKICDIATLAGETC